VLQTETTLKSVAPADWPACLKPSFRERGGERERERERRSLSSCRSYNCRRTGCIYTLKPSVSTRPAPKHFNYLCGGSARARMEGYFLPSPRSSPLRERLSDGGYRQSFAVRPGRLLRLQYRQIFELPSSFLFLSLSLSLSLLKFSRIRGWLNAAERKRNVGSLIFESTVA